MPEGVLEPGAEPLVRLVGDRGSVEGLSLLDGDLVLKIEYGGAAVQVRLRNVDRFPDDSGISVKHGFGLGIPLSVRRLLDFWRIAGRPAPRNGKGRGVGSDRQVGDGAGRTPGRQEAARDRGGHLGRGGCGGCLVLRQLDALAGTALDTEGGGARRRRLARVCAARRGRGVIGTTAEPTRRRAPAPLP